MKLLCSRCCGFHCCRSRALDKEVVDYTEQCEKEHAEYTKALASNNAAVDPLKFAMNRLNKFYQTTLNFSGAFPPLPRLLEALLAPASPCR